MKLPSEILHRIIEATSIYAKVNALLPAEKWYRRVVDRASLFNLALTCRRLTDVALPRLYQSPTTMNYSRSQSHGTAMIHTLCSRPDLAAHVVELTLGGDLWGFYRERTGGLNMNEGPERWRWQVSPDQATLFNQAFRYHGIADGGADDLWDSTNDAMDGQQLATEPYRIEAAKAPGDEICTHAWSNKACSALAALAIVKSPNLRRVMISSRSWRLPRTVRRCPTLESLQRVSWTCFTDERGFRLDSSLDWLVAAAPELQILNLWPLYGIGDILPCLLTDLSVIDVHLGENSIRSMCRGFPKLQRLTFVSRHSASGEGNATCTFILGCLVETYKTSLEYLYMDCTKNVPEFGAASGSLAQLTSMTALTQLILVGPLTHWVTGQNERMFWGSLLAPNLENLRLRDVTGHWNALPLLSAIDSTCPKMRKTTVDCDTTPRDHKALDCLVGEVGLKYDFCITPIPVYRAPSTQSEEDNSDNDGDDSGSDGNTFEM